MEHNIKLKRNAFILLAAMLIVFLLFLADTIRGFVLTTGEWHIGSIICTISGIILIAGVFCLAILLLNSVRSDVSPFSRKNVKRLKLIAIFLFLIELHLHVSEWVFNTFYPLMLENNIAITTHTSNGGIILTAGLVVFCVSLVFEHGIDLQQQVDETL